MNQKIQQILELPDNKKLGLLVGSLLLIVAVYYFLFYSSLNVEMSETEEAVKLAKAEIVEKTGMVKNLDKYKEEVEMLDIELVKALKELPDKEEIHLLLSKISDKARDAGLQIKLFKPTEEKKKDFYAEVPVELELDGTYHQVGTFFDEVGRLDRLVNLNGIKLYEPQVQPESTTLVKTKVLATTFRFLDESERPKQGEGEDASKKRRSKDDKKKKGKGEEDLT